MNDGTVIRNGHESHVRREQGLSSSELSTEGASARSRPGILVFSRGRQLLHINSRALERKILVRGFGLADRNLPDDSRIVIVLEEIGHRQSHKAQPMPVFSSKSLCAAPGTQQDPDQKTVVAAASPSF